MEFLIKKAKEEDLPALVDIYTSAFERHNIFERSAEEVMQYLRTLNGDILIAVEGGVIGGVVLKRKDKDRTASHTVWKFNHLAVKKDYQGKGVAKKLLVSAENEIREKINEGRFKTAKIEVSVSENEESALELYYGLGFEKEGMLKSHYRYGEKVNILGKEIIGEKSKS